MVQTNADGLLVDSLITQLLYPISCFFIFYLLLQWSQFSSLELNTGYLTPECRYAESKSPNKIKNCNKITAFGLEVTSEKLLEGELMSIYLSVEGMLKTPEIVKNGSV